MDYTKRVHRLLRIITLVQSRRAWTPASLAAELGVTERTLYRDLDYLRIAGIPLIFDRETSQYRILSSFFMPPVQLTGEEALSLAALCEQIAHDEQIPFLKPAMQALRKIESQLPSEVQEELADHAGAIAIQTAAAMPPDGYKDVYDIMRTAIALKRKLRCKYDSLDPGSDPNDEFELAPFSLFFSVRAWYVIGQRSDREDLRFLKLNRFTKVELTDRPYMIPDGFTTHSFLGNAWRMMRGPDMEVEIWFDPEFAQTISDTQWHRTQEIQWHDDESCTFRCTVSGLSEIVWWVLSMGPHCRVIKPPELIALVKDLAAQTAGLYETIDRG